MSALMTDEALTQSEFDHLRAAVLEQRRLSHMVRQRGIEIEALRRELADLSRSGERARGELTRRLERREEELKTARYESRRAERRVAKVSDDASAAARGARERLDDRTRQLEALREQRTRELEALRGEQARQLEALGEEQAGRLAALRAEVERLEGLLAEAGRELDLARRDARAAVAARDRARDALGDLGKAHDELRDELAGVSVARDRALEQLAAARAAQREAEDGLAAARRAGADALAEIERQACELGAARRDAGTLRSMAVERERGLADSDRALEQVERALERTRESRSWRLGHRLARLARAATFRPARSQRSALDVAEALARDARAVGAAPVSAP